MLVVLGRATICVCTHVLVHVKVPVKVVVCLVAVVDAVMDVLALVRIHVQVLQMPFITVLTVIPFVHLHVKMDVKNLVLEIVKQPVLLHAKMLAIQDVKIHAILLVKNIVKEDAKATVKADVRGHVRLHAKEVVKDDAQETVEAHAGDSCSLIRCSNLHNKWNYLKYRTNNGSLAFLKT